MVAHWDSFYMSREDEQAFILEGGQEAGQKVSAQQGSRGVRKALALLLPLALGVIAGGLLVAYQASSRSTSVGQNVLTLDEASVSPYTVFVDCGSTGSRLYVYLVSENPPSCSATAPTASPGGEKKLWDVTHYCDCPSCEPDDSALSSFQNDPEGAGTMIGDLVKNAQLYVPEAYADATPLFVLATAGMRLIPTDATRQIWSSVRAELLSGKYAGPKTPYKFKPSHAKNLAGNYEGVYQFLTVQNILNDNNIDVNSSFLLSNSTSLQGILEMGGASLQVSFRPETALNENAAEFYVDLIKTTIFSTSYLGFGSNAAFDRSCDVLVKQNPGEEKIDHPCLYNGTNITDKEVGNVTVTFLGTGDPDACRTLVKGLLHLDYECIQKPCSIMGQYQPGPDKKFGKFIGISGFFYAVYNLGLVGWGGARQVPPELIDSKTQDNCQVPWQLLPYSRDYGEAYNSSGEKNYFANCFNCMLVSELLSAFRFPKDDTSVIYTRKLANPPLGGGKGQSLTWTRGATLFQTLYMAGPPGTN